MKAKIYKPTLLILWVLLAGTKSFAQDISVSTQPDVSVKATVNSKELQVKMDEFGKNLKENLKDLGRNLSVTINKIAPEVNVQLKDITKSIDNLDFNISSNVNDDNYDAANLSLKVKNYTKTYPVDANDRIKLSSQYGKIIVNTWDRHEIKVDVEIRAEANSEGDAQKLLDNVQINDSKNGDQVSFKTEIGRTSSGGSWNIFNWGGNNNKHKLTINYTVYMPAKNDLNVEESYGSIVLPDMDGVVKISSSYGSVTAENLTNASNVIEGSYGSLKVGAMNGGKLDYSYGSADINECTNLKADLSYGSFKLGKLKGAAEFNISYVGGFKIDEIANSLKKLNIDASYSGVSLGVPNNNFEFDITTSYGGFNYNSDKVTITSKTPPDGSKHIGTTRNYKGHVGKGGSDAQVNIQTSYGGVNFE